MNNETLIAKLISFEFNGEKFTNEAHQEEFKVIFGIGFNDSPIVTENQLVDLIGTLTEDQVKALWKYEQRKEFFTLEDRLCELMGDDAAFEWIDDQE